MSDTFMTADSHFFHKNILKFCPTTRKGCDELEMNELMIESWNKKVKREDIVYHLGDVSFGSTGDTSKILSRLNGKIHLIEGNHDHKMIKDHTCRSRFDSIQPYLKIKMGNVDVILMHYAMRIWDKMHYGSYHLYGHSHNSMEHTPYGKSMDVGVDTRSDMSLWSWDEIDFILRNREKLGHHGD